MNKWLLRAPWWRLAIVLGLVAAVPVALLTRLGQDAQWPVVAAQTAVFVVVCGPVMGLLVRRQLDRQLKGVGDAPDELRQRVASRPTAFGPIPQDPAERAATRRLIEHQLGQLQRKQPRTVVLGLLLTAGMAWLASARSPWWWIAVAFWGVLVVLTLTAPRLLQRRAELLRESGE